MQQTIMLRIIPALLALAFSGTAGAAGFQLMEQSGSGLGNAFAGSAAVAENASTIFYNPAGLTYLSGRQVSAGLSVIDFKVKFSNGSSTNPALITVSGGNGGEAGTLAFVPNFYFSMPIDEKLSIGIGINAPFGLKTDYNDSWRGRFHGVKSDLKTININPSIAYKVSDTLSIGAGLNWQKIDATLTSVANAGGAVCSNATFLAAGGGAGATACGLGALINYESGAKLKGDDSAWGYNLGAIFRLSENIRLGLAYRSSVKYTVTGTASFSNPTVTTTGSPVLDATANAVIAGGLYNGAIKLDVKLPDIATASLYHRLDPRWELLGDVSWTGWAKIPKLDAIRTDGALSGTTLSHTQENWRNTWRAAFGAIYQYSDEMKLRMGTAFDQSPVDANNYRTPRLPDNNRYWLSMGMQYKLSGAGVLDVGYTHIFIPESSMSNNGQGADTASKGLIDGKFKSSVDILALQYTHAF